MRVLLLTLSLSLVPVSTFAQSKDAPIVSGARSLSETGRYASPRSYEDTVEFYRRHFRSRGGVRWRSIINQPGIKAVHIRSVRKATNWAGINVYETRGEARIFVIPRED